ncbi:hypothetical protein Cgig2_027809 [Carnegiea gigantea]|uniref:Bifunctional inhibitor/plant lipid transfer protein/seed storage helical domain-containing protein n=1 Tax=Carnegiea gigantea TaxID=171969 RepID=A0A9Q1K0P3_9CARY|nr:hypothetical protein Cgig2_027809 [Carnegiea gigantea]
MDSSKLSSLFLICILFTSTTSPILGCPYCGVPSPKPPSTPQPPATVPVPAVPIPPVTVPVPPVTVPPAVPLPPITVPPVTPVVPVLPVPLPPVVPVVPVLPVPLPPVVPVLPVPLPPVPVVNPPTTPGPSGKPCPPGPVGQPKCPINVLKLNVCVDVLGGLVHGVIGYPVKTKCCSVIKGLLDLEAAVCLCTILKLKALNLKIYAPIALELLVTCGKHIPPGFTCPYSEWRNE